MIQQTPWFDRRFHFDFPISDFPVIFSRLEGAMFRLHSILANADDEACSVGNGGWSVKEEMGHLSDLEELWFRRLQDFLDGREILSAADLTNRKTHEAGHNERSLEQLMQLFVGQRQKTLETIYDFDGGLLRLTAVHPRLQQPMRLVDSLYFVAEHDDHHIAKISALLRRSDRRFVE